MTKVTFYMKSGNKISLKFKEFEISRLYDNKNREMTWQGCKKHAFSIDLDEVEAVVIH